MNDFFGKHSEIDLNDLLPVAYRERDSELGLPLKAFLNVVSKQANILKRDIDGLWDDFFVETCQDWVLPYLGELVANNPVEGSRRRADVAKTIYYRRRKGRLPIVEELARDVTGWSARAVAFFELLAWTQNMNHVRLPQAAGSKDGDVKSETNPLNPPAIDSVATAHVRNLTVMQQVNSPFDVTAHTVDVRRIGPMQGWYNLRRIGLFIWRLRAYPLSKVTPLKVRDNQGEFYFSPFGAASPLFNYPEPESEEFGQAQEINIAAPIPPQGLVTSYYPRAISVYRSRSDASPVPANEIEFSAESAWGNRADPIQVLVDVQRGKLRFLSESPPDPAVSYSYGFSHNMGGGPYDREPFVRNPALSVITVGKTETIKTLTDAIEAWKKSGKSAALIKMTDSATYDEEALSIPAGASSLVIQAESEMRPFIRLTGPLLVTGESPAFVLSLNGLLIGGRLDVEGLIGGLEVIHSTFIPEAAPANNRREDDDGVSLSAYPRNQSRRVLIQSSVVGALRLPDTIVELVVVDSIVDAPSALPNPGYVRHAIQALEGGQGPRSRIERSTILGQVHVKELPLASDSLFCDSIKVEHRQTGCVRYCYVPNGSETPRRHRCQPLTNSSDLEPAFASTKYGRPDYAQLHHNCLQSIREGAENGAEMGAFCNLMQPQRERSLRLRLEEYLPFGMEAEILDVPMSDPGECHERRLQQAQL